MATTTMTATTAEELIGTHDTVAIDFWAGWCGPCRMFGPVFEAVSERHPDVLFAKVDTEAERELAAAFDVMSIPTLAIFREGVLVYSRPGALGEEPLELLLGQVAALDMDEVRAQAVPTGARSR